MAGRVVEVGRAVPQFKPGDRVVTETWGGCRGCSYCKPGDSVAVIGPGPTRELFMVLRPTSLAWTWCVGWATMW